MHVLLILNPAGSGGGLPWWYTVSMTIIKNQFLIFYFLFPHFHEIFDFSKIFRYLEFTVTLGEKKSGVYKPTIDKKSQKAGSRESTDPKFSFLVVT